MVKIMIRIYYFWLNGEENNERKQMIILKFGGCTHVTMSLEERIEWFYDIVDMSKIGESVQKVKYDDARKNLCPKTDSIGTYI